jgi:hypothetical protein
MRTGVPAWVLVPLLACAAVAAAGEPELKPNQWVKLEKAALVRGSAPLVWEPELKRFMVLGGAVSWDKYEKPHPFDDLALDLARGEWENWIPKGKEWGPQFGDCKAPTWKTGYWTMTDAEGNCRPNQIVNAGMRTLTYHGQYAFDPEAKRTCIYAYGGTFAYDAAARAWKDLAPANHPNKALGGELFWGAMCYVAHLKKIVLFGGGNVETERGDPGTWTYDPAANAWEQLKLDKQPPQRALSRMVYDPVAKKVVLFGGDGLNQLLSDTWTFDGQKWEEKTPALCPAPRAGHAMLWLPEARKILLLGGYAYESGYGGSPVMYRHRPLDAWTYDAAADKWECVAAWDKGGPWSSLGDMAGLIGAAAGAGDVVLAISRQNRYTPLETWACRIDASRANAAETARLGAKPRSESGSALLQGKPGAVERRVKFHDPEWYKQAGPGDPAKTEAELAAVAANTWTPRPQPNRPDLLGDWGTSVFFPERDAIVRWAGGHSDYGGTAPLVYDVKADRWSLAFAPEMYLELCGSNGGLLDGWSFSGSPWMPGHTYNATGYEPESKTMLYVGTRHTYFFDPAKGRWSRAEKPSPFQAHQHVTTLANTPRGVVAWVGQPGYETALYLLDAKERTWSKLPLKGTLPLTSADQHGMVYDAKRDRLLFFSAADKNKGDAMAYDMKIGEARWLNAAGKAKAGVPSRNALYLPEFDAVLIGHHVAGQGGAKLWPLYDCEKNAWSGVAWAGEDPLAKDAFYNLGLMYDARRKLVWTTTAVNRASVLKADPKTVVLQKLE